MSEPSILTDVSRIDYPCGCSVERWKKHDQMLAVRHCSEHVQIVLDGLDSDRSISYLVAKIDDAARKWMVT